MIAFGAIGTTAKEVGYMGGLWKPATPREQLPDKSPPLQEINLTIMLYLYPKVHPGS